jgi:histidinol-phosphate aminotransferase
MASPSSPEPRADRVRLAALGGRDDAPAGAVRLDLNTAPAEAPGLRERLARELDELTLSDYGDERALGLRRSLATHTGRRVEEIFVAGGSMAVLERLVAGWGGAGRTALGFAPGYLGAERLCAVLGTTVALAPRDAAFGLDADRALAAVREHRPDLVLLCHPGNPSGRPEEPDTVRALCAAAPGALIVVDEAYVDFAAAPSMLALTDEVRPNLVVVRSLSKAWALAGARVGYAVADPAIVRALQDGQLPGAVSALTQAVARAALGEPAADRAGRIAAIVAERERVERALDAQDGVRVWPSQANFVLFAPPDPADVLARCAAAGVLIRDVGGRPGLEGCLRATIGAPAANDALLSAIGRAPR